MRAVRASLHVLTSAPDRIGFPLLAAVYRAALGGVNFGVFLSGRSGVFKTALAGLCQQHFGAAMEASRLPANFASTGNALELLAFCAKDALLVVDDFAPSGGAGDGESPEGRGTPVPGRGESSGAGTSEGGRAAVRTAGAARAGAGNGGSSAAGTE